MITGKICLVRRVQVWLPGNFGGGMWLHFHEMCVRIVFLGKNKKPPESQQVSVRLLS